MASSFLVAILAGATQVAGLSAEGVSAYRFVAAWAWLLALWILLVGLCFIRYGRSGSWTLMGLPVAFFPLTYSLLFAALSN